MPWFPELCSLPNEVFITGFRSELRKVPRNPVSAVEEANLDIQYLLDRRPGFLGGRQRVALACIVRELPYSFL